jgi:hypothetical protein
LLTELNWHQNRLIGWLLPFVWGVSLLTLRRIFFAVKAIDKKMLTEILIDRNFILQ